MIDADALLQKRERTHGRHEDVAQVYDCLLQAIPLEAYPPGWRYSVTGIYHKLARMVSGRGWFPGHAEDVRGYAQLLTGGRPVVRGGSPIEAQLMLGEAHGRLAGDLLCSRVTDRDLDPHLRAIGLCLGFAAYVPALRPRFLADLVEHAAALLEESIRRSGGMGGGD